MEWSLKAAKSTGLPKRTYRFDWSQRFSFNPWLTTLKIFLEHYLEHRYPVDALRVEILILRAQIRNHLKLGLLWVTGCPSRIAFGQEAKALVCNANLRLYDYKCVIKARLQPNKACMFKLTI